MELPCNWSCPRPRATPSPQLPPQPSPGGGCGAASLGGRAAVLLQEPAGEGGSFSPSLRKVPVAGQGLFGSSGKLRVQLRTKRWQPDPRQGFCTPPECGQESHLENACTTRRTGTPSGGTKRSCVPGLGREGGCLVYLFYLFCLPFFFLFLYFQRWQH